MKQRASVKQKIYIQKAVLLVTRFRVSVAVIGTLHRVSEMLRMVATVPYLLYPCCILHV